MRRLQTVSTSDCFCSGPGIPPHLDVGNLSSVQLQQGGVDGSTAKLGGQQNGRDDALWFFAAGARGWGGRELFKRKMNGIIQFFPLPLAVYESPRECSR